MTLPALLFGFLVSSFIGAMYHLWRNGGLGRLVLFLILSWAGFWLGHTVANLLGWTFLSLGPIRYGMALPASILFLLAGDWLSLINLDEDKEDQKK